MKSCFVHHLQVATPAPPAMPVHMPLTTTQVALPRHQTIQLNDRADVSWCLLEPMIWYDFICCNGWMPWVWFVYIRFGCQPSKDCDDDWISPAKAHWEYKNDNGYGCFHTFALTTVCWVAVQWSMLSSPGGESLFVRRVEPDNRRPSSNRQVEDERSFFDPWDFKQMRSWDILRTFGRTLLLDGCMHWCMNLFWKDNGWHIAFERNKLIKCDDRLVMLSN